MKENTIVLDKAGQALIMEEEEGHGITLANFQSTIGLHKFVNLTSSGDWSHTVLFGRYSTGLTKGLSAKGVAIADNCSITSEHDFAHCTNLGNNGTTFTRGNIAHAVGLGIKPSVHTEGENCISASLGSKGVASAGETGVLLIAYFDETKNRLNVAVGLVGENGIKPFVDYVVDKQGNFIEAEVFFGNRKPVGVKGANNVQSFRTARVEEFQSDMERY